MGLFGGGNSKTSNQVDNSSRQNTGQFAGMEVGDDNWITIESSDAEVVEVAGDAIADVASDAFNFGEDALDGMSDVSRYAFSAMEDVASDAFNTVEDVASDAFNFGESALDSMEDVTSDALAFGEESLSFADDALTSSLDFAENAQSEANALSHDALDYMSRNSEAAFELSENTLSSMEGVTNSALDYSGEQFSQMIAFGEDMLGETLGTVRTSNADSLMFAQNVNDSSLDFAQESMGQVAEQAAAHAFALENISANQANASSEQLATLTALAKSTTSGGQTEIASNAKDMVMYIVIGLTVFGVGLIVLKGRK